MKNETRIEIPMVVFYRRKFGNISGSRRSYRDGFSRFDEEFFREGCERGCSDLAVDYERTKVRRPFLGLLGASLGFAACLSSLNALETRIDKKVTENYQQIGYVVEEIGPVAESI